jgi:exodeoxyribonuclease VIII
MKTNTQNIDYTKDTFPEYLGKKDHISASDIKSFMKSPQYYFFNKYAEKKQRNEDSRHYIIGSALHESVLEPHQFFDNYTISPKFDRRTKEGKKEYEDFVISNKNKGILFEDEMDMITKMGANALKNKSLTEFICDSYRELSIYTIDEKTGLKIKLRPDVYCKNKSTIVDIKTCVDSSSREFKRNVYSYGYSISAAFYIDFSNRENYIFCAIEKNQPHQVSLYALNDEMIEYGRQQYRMGLDLLKWSYDNNYWCDYNEFEILKESYHLGTLETFLETLKNSDTITILN